MITVKRKVHFVRRNHGRKTILITGHGNAESVFEKSSFRAAPVRKRELFTPNRSLTVASR